MRARFYAALAPEWWPFQVVSVSNRRLPPRRPGFYAIIVDNGMFAMYLRGARPPLDRWYSLLASFVHDVERLRAPREVIIVLPDWVGDPRFTVEAARHPLARRLCSAYTCYAVAHGGEGMMGYARTAEELASVDHVAGLAAPLKLPCSRYSARAGRRVVRAECQAAITEQVCGVARAHGLPCHGLGVHLRPEHVRRLVGLGLTSFDTSSWTRPVNKPEPWAAAWSAKTAAEREQYFVMALRRLLEAGVPLELPNTLPQAAATAKG